MESVSKGMTYSVRLSKTMANAFDRLSKLIQINKSDFLRVCIEKLCKDNRLYLDHIDKVKQYTEYIRTEMSRISSKKIVVENGSWETTKEVSILMLCDLLLRWTDEVFDSWFNVMLDYGLIDKDDKSEAKQTFSDGLIFVEDIGFILSPTRIATDVKALIEDDVWWDDLETKRVSLLFATKMAIENHSAEKLVDCVIKRTSKEEGEATIILVDAKGGFKRSGSIILTPAEYEKISKVRGQGRAISRD